MAHLNNTRVKIPNLTCPGTDTNSLDSHDDLPSKPHERGKPDNGVWKGRSLLRGGTETNRQCFADICKSRQSRFGSKSRIYCRIDALKTINTAQRHVDTKHRQLILPTCTRFIANLTLPTLVDIGNALPISLCAVPKLQEDSNCIYYECENN